MRDIKAEEAESRHWQDYRIQNLQPSDSTPSYIANLSSASQSLPHASPQRSRDPPHPRPSITSLSTQLSPSSNVSSILTSPTSLASLKRPFGSQQPNDASEGSGTDVVDQEASQKPTIHQDHQLLSFFRAPDQHTLFDIHGQKHIFDLTLHLQGMFFLAESSIPIAGGKSPYQQPELTCYRRNLFAVAGSVSVPRGTLSCITNHGERATIISQELSISATESVDGNPIRLIVIPWKTPPPNTPQPTKQDQEPPTFPLLPFEGSDTATGESLVYPIAWRRLQFRIATANNGRRKELQQHFVLSAKITASLSNGSKIIVCEASTAPIVVRGRSPRNFQSKKETPLSSKSTALAPIDTQKHSFSGEPPDKSISPHSQIPPPSSFQFDTSHLPPFSAWPSLPQQFSPTGTKPSTSLSSAGSLNTIHSGQSSPELRRHNSTVGESPGHYLPSIPTGSLPLNSYSDSPRPTKSPRHVQSPVNGPMYHPFRDNQEVPFHGNVPDDSDSYEREYYVASSHPEPWVATAQSNTTSASPHHHQFQYPPDMYVKNEQSHPAQTQYPWTNA